MLTLIQTGKMQRIPVVLVGRAFWRRVVDFDLLLDEGYVSSSDPDLFTCVDDAEKRQCPERFRQQGGRRWGKYDWHRRVKLDSRGTAARQKPMEKVILLIAGALFSPISALVPKSHSLQILLPALLARAIPCAGGAAPCV